MPAFAHLLYCIWPSLPPASNVSVNCFTATDINRWTIKGGEKKPFLQKGNRRVTQKEGSGEGRHYLRKNNHGDDHMFLLNDECGSKAPNK